MTLPSPIGGSTTAQVGYFECPAPNVAEWLASDPEENWTLARASVKSLEDVVATLAPGGQFSRYVCVPVGSWTAVMTDGPLGTDVGVLPSYAARELRCRALRAANFDDTHQFPARILEVFGPSGAPPLALERSIVAANDGGKWVFETSGTPLPFEDEAAYRMSRIAERFTSEMLLRYLQLLGVPIDEPEDWSNALLVTQPT